MAHVSFFLTGGAEIGSECPGTSDKDWYLTSWNQYNERDLCHLCKSFQRFEGMPAF